MFVATTGHQMLHVWTQGDVSAGIVGICQDILCYNVLRTVQTVSGL